MEVNDIIKVEVLRQRIKKRKINKKRKEEEISSRSELFKFKFIIWMI